MYICEKCSKDGIIKKHKSGKIYKDHLKYKRIEKSEYDSEEIDKIDFPLREIAKRQIGNLLAQIEYTPSRRGVYIQKINKLIEYERERERKRAWALKP